MEEIDLEVYVDGEFFAGASGSGDHAWAEIKHYISLCDITENWQVVSVERKVVLKKGDIPLEH